MGLVGWAEVHPFTIASVAKTPEGVVLLCKNVGGWTNRLYEMAKVAGYGCEDGDASRTVTVMLDGPYGVAFPHFLLLSLCWTHFGNQQVVRDTRYLRLFRLRCLSLEAAGSRLDFLQSRILFR